MIDFMVIGLPRSGTTWAANWLTTDCSLCIHDPLNAACRDDWARRFDAPGKLFGVACTAIWHWPDWVNAHPAKKLVLHRPVDQVAASMRRLGLAEPPSWAPEALIEIDALHMTWSDLFDPWAAGEAWAHLIGDGFDSARHAELAKMVIQPNFAAIKPDAEATRSLRADVRAILQRKGM